LLATGYTHELVSTLAAGDQLGGIREVLIGNAKIVPIQDPQTAFVAQPPIRTAPDVHRDRRRSSTPNVPSGLYLTGEGIEHRKMGKITLEKREDGKLYANGKEVVRHLSPNQKNSNVIQGYKAPQGTEDMQVLNACILDALRAQPQLIPDEWEDRSPILGNHLPRRGRRLVRRMPVLARRSVALGLLLARRRLELQRPGRGARKLVLGYGGWSFLILCPLALRISFCPAHELPFFLGFLRGLLYNVIK